MALLLGHPMQMKYSVMRRGKLHVVGGAFLWPGSAMESRSAWMGLTSSAVSRLPAVLCYVSCTHPHLALIATCLVDSCHSFTLLEGVLKCLEFWVVLIM